MTLRKQRSGWALSDEIELIDRWEAHSQDLRKAKRNAHIYQNMAQEMGNRYTGEEIHYKVKNLAKKYREEKTKMGPSGGSPSEWKHYQAVHRIIGSTAVNSTTCMSSYHMNSLSIQTPQQPSATSALPTPSCVVSSPTFMLASPSPPLPSPSPPLPSSSPSLPSPSPSLPSPSPSLPSPSPSLSSPSPSSPPVPSSTERKRNYNGEMVRIMKEQTEIMKSSADEAKVVNDEIVGAIRDHNRMTERFLNMMEKLTEKL